MTGDEEASQLHRVLKALFQQHGQEQLRLEQAKLILCYTFRWFDPGQAELVITTALDRGLLQEEGPNLNLTVELSDIPLSPGFAPDFEELMASLPVKSKGTASPKTGKQKSKKSPTPEKPSHSSPDQESSELSPDPKKAAKQRGGPSKTPASEASPTKGNQGKVASTSSGRQGQDQKSKKTPGSSGSSFFPGLLDRLMEHTGMDRKELMQQLNRSQKQHQVTDIEAEALLLAVRTGLELEGEFQEARELILARYSSDQ